METEENRRKTEMKSGGIRQRPMGCLKKTVLGWAVVLAIAVAIIGGWMTIDKVSFLCRQHAWRKACKKALCLQEQAERKAESIERQVWNGRPDWDAKRKEMRRKLEEGKGWLDGKGFREAEDCFRESMAVATWLEVHAASNGAVFPGESVRMVHGEE